MRASHNIEIVKITAGSCRDDVIALGDQNKFSIADSDTFIKAFLIIYPLESEPICGRNMMVVGLLQIGFMGRILGIVFVGRER